ncbi:DUF3597 domain-containing protein [Shinella fusca]|uniref:DUF3597 domain-containing protein n=1 Tax=Shinella fusca TaxID=544480 RepID=A0A7W7YSK1_9HYPH|nr:DUF3597 domain-containing protein [Shinella fusca]MBB5041506.1 hypothetical protein [Shinella fusca]
MGIFSRIKEKLFGNSKENPNHTVTADAGQSVAAGVTATSTTGSKAGPAQTPEAAEPSLSNEVTAALAGANAEPAASVRAEAVDVAAIMDAAVKKSGQKLDWRRSIVDMMKALDLDSSLSARKELADELGFTGDKNDSATMNVWLHKALMKALADNGGKVPPELLD